MGELGDDGRVDVGVVHLGRREEDVDLRLYLAGELLEHQVLVLHLGGETRRLEQAGAIPLQRGDAARIGGIGDRVGIVQVDAQPFVDESQVVARHHHLLDVLDHAVVLGMEHVVHRGQADVLVAAAVAGDEVTIEQFVVVGQALPGNRVAQRFVRCGTDDGVVIRSQLTTDEQRHGIVRDVVEEGVVGSDRQTCIHRSSRGTGLMAASGHDLRETCARVRDEVAIGVGGNHRQVEHVGIIQLDTEDVQCLRLDVRPGRQAAVLAIEHAPGVYRPTVDQHVLAQEHLVRRVRRVGLVLVDERSGLVVVQIDVVIRLVDTHRIRIIADDAIRAAIHRDVGGTAEHHELQFRRQIVGALIYIERVGIVTDYPVCPANQWIIRL
ncbi:hypothetical protein D9M68_228420 [compost metagenome]